jgi:2,4-dienoyl-CoA reductase (NADPH2)
MISAGCSPNEAGCCTKNSFSLHDDEHITKHNLITRSVHRNGGLIALQLLHYGREAYHGNLVAPSPVRNHGNFYTPIAMDDEDIERTMEEFGGAARRAVEAGYDAVELHYGQGFLVHEFLTRATNFRTDKWGGSFANRAAFSLGVAESVRKAVGNSFPIIFRLPCLDLVPEGLSFEEVLQLIDWLRPFGIDLLNVSIGFHESKTPTIASAVPTSGFSLIAKRIKQLNPDLKVAVSNRINDVRDAEALLQNGVADVVSMARPFLADPKIVAKSKRGDYDRVNKCIACNQDCLDNVFLAKSVSCAVNPTCNEVDEGIVTASDDFKKIAVIGGGVAGLSAAYYLARKGHKVSLYEQGHHLGGQVNIASRIPNKQEFDSVVRYFTSELIERNVELRLGVKFGASHLEEHWDHIVVAIGSTPRKLEFDVDSTTTVLSYDDVITRGIPVDFPAVIVGGGGVACDVAKYMLDLQSVNSRSSKYLEKQLPLQDYKRFSEETPRRPKDITLIQRSSRKLGHKLGRTTRWITIEALQKKAVKFHNQVELERIRNNMAILKHKNGSTSEIPVMTLIVAAGQVVNEKFISDVAKSGRPYIVIGAAATSDSSVTISRSIRAGYQVAKDI